MCLVLARLNEISYSTPGPSTLLHWQWPKSGKVWQPKIIDTKYIQSANADPLGGDNRCTFKPCSFQELFKKPLIAYWYILMHIVASFSWFLMFVHSDSQWLLRNTIITISLPSVPSPHLLLTFQAPQLPWLQRAQAPRRRKWTPHGSWFSG